MDCCCYVFFIIFIVILITLRYYHHKISNEMKVIAKSQLAEGEHIVQILHAPVFMTVIYSLVLTVTIDNFYHLFVRECLESIDTLFFINITLLSFLILKYLPQLFKKNFYAVTNFAIKPIEKQDAESVSFNDIKSVSFDNKVFLIKSVCVVKKDGSIERYAYINHSEQFYAYLKTVVNNQAE